MAKKKKSVSTQSKLLKPTKATKSTKVNPVGMNVASVFEKFFPIIRDGYYQGDGFLLTIPDKVVVAEIKPTRDNSGIHIKFGGNPPKVTVRKIIEFTLDVTGVSLYNDGGVLEVSNFPDISFDYNFDF